MSDSTPKSAQPPPGQQQDLEPLRTELRRFRSLSEALNELPLRSASQVEAERMRLESKLADASGPAAEAGATSDLVGFYKNVVAERWRLFWGDVLSICVRWESSGAEPQREAENLVDSKGPEVFVLNLSGCRRAARRLVNKIDLECMVEERIFSDYARGIRQTLDEMHQEASTALRAAATGLSTLEKLREKKVEVSAPYVDSLRKVLQEAVDRSAALIDFVSERERFVDSLRGCWARVDYRWGTWQRRIRRPSIVLWGMGVIGLALYALIGAFLPTPLVLLVALGAALGLAIQEYFQARTEVETPISGLRKCVEPLRPELETGSAARRSFWDGGKPRAVLNGILGALERAKGRDSGEALELRPIEEEERMKRRWCRAAMLAWLAPAALWVSYGCGFEPVTSHVPTYYVVAGGPQCRGCPAPAGIVFWAGPVTVAVGSSDRGLFMIDASDISRLQKEKPAEPREQDEVPARAGIVLFEPGMRLERGEIVVVPFPGRQSCKIRVGHEGASLPEAQQELLSYLAGGLAGCSQGSRARVAVAGFASSRDFDVRCPETSSNARLAEARRRTVLKALGACARTSSGGDCDSEAAEDLETSVTWEHDAFAIDSQSLASTNFNDVGSAGGSVDPLRERLSRHVEVRLVDLGSCGREAVVPSAVGMAGP